MKNLSESPDSNRSSDSHSNILKDSPIFRNSFRSDNIHNICIDEVSETEDTERSDYRNVTSNLNSDRNVPKSCNAQDEIIDLHESIVKQGNKSIDESYV